MSLRVVILIYLCFKVSYVYDPSSITFTLLVEQGLSNEHRVSQLGCQTSWHLHGCCDPNCNPHACVASALPPAPSPRQPCFKLDYFKH